MAMQAVTDTDFSQHVLESKKPVVVDFWASWCGPCKALAPLLEEASKEVSSVSVTKMNIEENLQTPSSYGVRSIPTLIAFKDGKPVSSLVGLRSKDEIVAWLQAQA
ncbi:MAG: thioredoxin [Alphaproteobacteria bacterium]